MTNQSIAYIFPGQGSQSATMLAELSPHFIQIDEMFERASAVLRYDLLAAAENPDCINQTEFTQPILLTISMGIWQVLQSQGILAAHPPQYLAGHSLGEYTALCAAEVFDFETAIGLVNRRAKLMATAVPLKPTAMAAVLGKSAERVESVCQSVMASLTGQDELVAIANYNSPSQIVITGTKTATEQAVQQLEQIKARVIRLPVSVPSHCQLLDGIRDEFAVELEQITFATPRYPILQNRTASIATDVSVIKQSLLEQLSYPVLWQQSMSWLSAQGVDTAIECGVGQVLTNLGKRQKPKIVVYPTNNVEHIQQLKEGLV